MLLMPLGVMRAPVDDQPRTRRVHLKDVYIAGTQYHDMSSNEEIQTLKVCDPLVLRREPENPHDASAIAVFTTSGRKVGYCPRHQNRTVARLMDQGVPVKAYVDKVAPDDAAWKRIWIRVEEEI
jgi:hypothetical protein